MKKLTSLFLSFALIAATISCAPSDDKISEAVKTALSGNADLNTVSTSVEDGVVTMRGDCIVFLI